MHVDPSAADRRHCLQESFKSQRPRDQLWGLCCFNKVHADDDMLSIALTDVDNASSSWRRRRRLQPAAADTIVAGSGIRLDLAAH